MGGFIGVPCDPDLDPNCFDQGGYPSSGGVNITVIQDAGVAAALADIIAIGSLLASVTGNLKSLAGLIIGSIAKVLTALALIWTTVLAPVLKAIKKALDTINKWLDKILKPQLAWMRAVRKIILDFYNKYVRPLIVFIERFRRLIHLLQLLHIHIFDKLDRTLGRIEATIMRPLYLALYRLNTLGSWVSFILNAKLLIYRSLFLRSLQANQGGAFNMLATSPTWGFQELPHVAPGVAIAPAIAFVDFTATADAALVPAIAQAGAGSPAGATLALDLSRFDGTSSPRYQTLVAQLLQ